MPLSFLIAATSEPVVTWIKVEKPKLDIIGLVLGSFALTGFFILIALSLGALFGFTLIYRRRDHTDLPPQLDIQSR